MSKVMPGRFTAETDEPFVVFLIGMRINKIFAVNKWFPTAMAMTPMLRTLYKHPEKGFFRWRNFSLLARSGINPVLAFL